MSESSDIINDKKRMMLRSSSVPTIGEAPKSATAFGRKKSAPLHTTVTLNNPNAKSKNNNEIHLDAAWAAFRT
jgi:hypothetical protein